MDRRSEHSNALDISFRHTLEPHQLMSPDISHILEIHIPHLLSEYLKFDLLMDIDLD